jgi:hypothetical protein
MTAGTAMAGPHRLDTCARRKVKCSNPTPQIPVRFGDAVAVCYVPAPSESVHA